ncbi:MAG: type II secretion system GspH family protein [Rickettsiales bacterium]|nr:type II secretion system GspH family protein [Rickettsiales bacterium]
MKKNTKTNRGFSLLELSIVMVAMAFIATGLMRIAINTTKVDKREETERKLDVISKRLALFVFENQRLPCPSDGTLAANVASYGEEQDLDNGAAVNTCENGIATSGNMHVGSVPTIELNLPDSYMVDGWERRFNYAVDTRFTNNNITFANCDGTTAARSVCFEFLSNGSIEIGTTVDGAERTNEAVYVLISYGENGHGAYPRGGGTARLNVSASASEQENAHMGETFDAGFIDIDESNTFDDILYYAEKSQIIANIWPPIDESVCEVVKNVVDNPDPAVNDTCTGIPPSLIIGTDGPLEYCQLYAENINAVCAGLYN